MTHSRGSRGSRWRLLVPVVGSVALTGLPGAVEQAWAQAPRMELDLSATRIEYDTLAPLDAPSLSALAEWQRPSLFGRVAAGITGFEDAGWSVQGRGNLAGWLSPFGILSPFRLELAGSAGGSRYSLGFDSFVARSDLRAHLRGRRVGAWGGASLATAKNSFDSAAVTGVVPSVGLWTQTGSVRGAVTYVHTTVSGDSYPEANLALTLSRGAVDLTVYGGLRASPFDGVEGERWAGASGAVWLTEHAAVVLAGGRYAADLLQGLPGGEFFSVGLRLTPRRSRPIPAAAPAPIVYTTAETRAGGVGFHVPGARRVEIAGDWNAWVPEPLRRDASGRWLLPTSLEPGVYRFNLRVDGERWVVPDEVPSIDDGFGGRVGLLIVSESE